MNAIIFHHPHAKVQMDDPREPPHPVDPPHVKALKGELHPNDCAGCGKPMLYHYDLTGCLLLGCEFASRYDQQPKPMHPSYGQLPYVTVAVRKALLLDCGPAMTEYVNTFSFDDLLAVAERIGRAAVKAYQQETGQ